ncbi:lanthionine synthetase LanC family protein [Duganella violaceipulchra]|uniref:Lanthionine synthetase C family protein n=1 Tax=Duganella violaceipulchra TaxID=2849652 RepID=A0AA41H418_9BURK|nr:lanthionine synthetase LanC family protein [Duganella violaceicalia]MBV6320617.1 hypothetical protein [Duganella violaceicalia]MCP2008674.1 hypothetical protein [Duganella violaceicalia]
MVFGEVYSIPLHMAAVATDNVQFALTRGEASLANGLAGALLMQGQMYSRFPTATHRQLITALVEKLIEVIQTRELDSSLWHGITGVLYAIEFIRSVDANLIPVELEEFIADMDEQLLAYVEGGSRTLHFGLATGVAGLGAYALMRNDIEMSKRLYGAVEDALLAMSIEENGRRVWLTRQGLRRPLTSAATGVQGQVDIGMTQGLAGLVQLFSGAVRYGLGSARTPELLQSTVEALVAYRRPPTQGATFPYLAAQTAEVGSGLAWCYGDLSAATAIHSAGLALIRDDWQALGRDIIEERLMQPAHTFHLHDDSLCHGRAGAMHLLNKIYGGSPAFPVPQALNGGESIKPRHGLFAGSAGLLLTKIDGAHRGRHHWDVCMYMGF